MDYLNRPLEELVVANILLPQLERDGYKTYIRFEDETATYLDIHRRALELESVLDSLSVEPGELVGLMLPNGISYVELYFGLVYRGAAVVLINTTFRGYMLEYVLNDAGCTTLIADEQFLPTILQSANNLTALQSILVTGTSDSAGERATTFRRIAVTSLESLAPRGGANLSGRALPERSHADLHCVVYSSGTTGPSKGIMISNAHAIVKADEVLQICQFTESDVLYSPLPLFYSMGLLRGVLSVAMVGSSIALRDKFSVSGYWDDVRRHEATVGHCVFSIPQMLKQAPSRANDADNPLRCMFNAQSDLEFERRFGVKMIESYGLTEAGNAIYNRLDRPAKPGSCGEVSDDWEVRLADAHGTEVADGETGEILLRPRRPSRIMIGYLNKPEVTTTAFRDLWFHTGDLARRDRDGYFFYQGRNKDVIRRRGQNISAWEVEQILLTHPAVSQAAAMAWPSKVGEDDLRVVIVARDEVEELDLATLWSFCEERMPAYMVPRYYERVTDLPKTPSGRVEKYKLEGSLSDGYFDRDGQ
jgi:carnitine-CoA ligase